MGGTVRGDALFSVLCVCAVLQAFPTLAAYEAYLSARLGGPSWWEVGFAYVLTARDVYASIPLHILPRAGPQYGSSSTFAQLVAAMRQVPSPLLCCVSVVSFMPRACQLRALSCWYWWTGKHTSSKPSTFVFPNWPRNCHSWGCVSVKKNNEGEGDP